MVNIEISIAYATYFRSLVYKLWYSINSSGLNHMTLCTGRWLVSEKSVALLIFTNLWTLFSFTAHQSNPVLNIITPLWASMSLLTISELISWASLLRGKTFCSGFMNEYLECGDVIAERDCWCLGARVCMLVTCFGLVFFESWARW